MELTQLIESIDIVEFLSQYTGLEQRGDEFWGLSPLKEEKTPSFSVRPSPPCFYDYSSGVGGNVFTFVKYYYNCGAKKAVEILKKYAGFDGEILAPREKMAATTVCKKYQKAIKTKKPSKTAILPDDYMERFEKRDDKLAVWEQEGISRESLDRFQVFYDGFSDRLVYPIRNQEGKIVNVGGRTLDPEWKEKKLRKYTYFQEWGSMDVIYGLAENIEAIQKKKEIILFEGCKSVLIADTWGIRNTAALLTSHLSANQLKMLIKLGYRVVFALDKEIDVRKDHNINKLKRYVNVEFLHDRDNLLDEKDAPVDKGFEVFQKLYINKLRLR